nr:GtrA family protein [Legionella sp. PL877]
MLTGGISLIVNFCSRILYNYSFGFSISIIFAYITGMVTAFTLSKLFVFRHGQQTFLRSIVFFILVNLMGLLQTLLISLILAYYVLPTMNISAYTHEIAHAFGLIFPVFTIFLGHKYWTFRSL